MGQVWQLASAGGYTIPDDVIFFQAAGCDKCRGIGYHGRTGIYELLEVSQKLRDGFLRCRPIEERQEIAVKEGFHTLAANGIRKAVEGETSIEEVLRVISG